MQNVVSKELVFTDILNYYKNGESFNRGLGLEYERISLDIETYNQAPFEALFKIIKEFAQINKWNLIYDLETLIGAKNNYGSSISLEPGGQFELSLAPKEELYCIHFAAKNYLNQIDYLGEKYGVKFVSIGNSPKNICSEMEILNKRRYKLMAEFLPLYGKMAPVMMRETAGVQVNIDYKNSLDARRKIKAAILMSPFITGFFANSPIRNGKLTEYKSIRALAWKYTGKNRCGIFYKDLIDNSSGNLYEQYASYILDIPMIYIERNGKYIKMEGGLTFREFMKNGWQGYSAELSDYIIHQSLCFPDVRLKNCIEIRNHDSQSLDVAIGIMGIYKGILYNDEATDEILNFLSVLTADDIDDYGFLAARFGINFKIDKLNTAANKIIERILCLAQDNLPRGEQKYLDWFIELAKAKRCIADSALLRQR